jgi:vancomycin resistance protein YoaR
VVSLPVRVTPPAVDMSDPQALGIRELLSVGQTQFAGSTAERINNIEVTAQRLHGVVVPPGGVFSFVQPLGDATEADGYQEAYVIYGDRTVMGIGGGVCQVSTTCFRAAWWAGLPILARTPHAFRISWYEPPLGMDATVFSPSVDFKFKNDTPAYLLIQTEVDKINSTVTFRFYGTKPDRVVEMEGPYTSNVIPAPAPVYEYDPTLPRGTTKQTGAAHDGIDVTIYRIIKQDGQVVKRELFFTRFQPWAAQYLIGTKGP